MAVRAKLFRGLVREVEEEVDKFLSTHDVRILHVVQSESGDHLSLTFIYEDPEPLS